MLMLNDKPLFFLKFNMMNLFISEGKKFLNEVVFTHIPKILVALLLLWAGLKLIKLFNRFLNRIFKRHEVDKSLQQFLYSLIDAILKVLLFLTVMGVAGIKTTSFVAIIGAAGLAVGMALQGTLQNFAGGVMILLLKPFKVGDYVEQDRYAGFVEKIQIFCTSLRTYDNRIIIVPNTELATKSLVNHFNQPSRRIAISVGVAYGESVEEVRKVLLEVANNHPFVLKEPQKPLANVENLGDSAVEFSLYVWCLPENYWKVYYDLNQQVYEAFLKANIKIPFNQLEVHLDK